MTTTLSDILDLKNEMALTMSLSAGEVFGLRSKRRAVLLANSLLNQEGKLFSLDSAIRLLETQGYILAPNGYSDADITDHFLRVLKIFQTSSRLVQRLQSFGLPLCDPKLAEMIAITLDTEDQLTDRHVIWAVLSALLCPLRQSVGSCFATAPAIIVHEQQIPLFLDDMQELLTKGRLTRVLGGVESSVPISPTPGIGELKKGYRENHPGFEKALLALGLQLNGHSGHSFLDVLEALILDRFDLKKRDLLKPAGRHSPKQDRIENAKAALQKGKWQMVAFSEHLLLKTWEFTLASFVDVKTEFSRWNLYSSLGLHPEEKGGIGELIYIHLEQMLSEANKKLDHYVQEYEIAFDQVRATEQLLKGAASESDARRLKAEHQARVYHMYACLELRDKWSKHAQNTANFFSFLVEQIIAKFQEFFQEVYDAEMQEVQGGPYDDSPAGFRLLYKHRRSHVGSWTFIHNRDEYIQALKDFFLAIENYLIESCTWEEGKQTISHLITAIIHRISSEEFIISAFYRMAKAHRVPLQKLTMDQLEKMEKKPWAYTSGGTIPTLLKTYFRREGTLSEEARWVESPQDLLIFILETLKMLPPRITDPFVKDPQMRMLMTAPTHAFSLLPGQELLRQGWEDRGFTYTWVRDQILLPGQEFYSRLSLSPHDQLYLIDEFANRLPPLQGHEIRRHFELGVKSLSVQAFRQKLPPGPTSDAFLYEMLPLITPDQAQELNLKLPPFYGPIGRRPLHDLIIGSYPLYQNHDLHLEIAKLMKSPRPLLFGDSNWAKFYFSFLVNPSTGQFELWRTDKIGLTGAPMTEWEPYLNGTLKEAWGIFLKPYEYSLI